MNFLKTSSMLRAAGFVMGVICILGSIAAWNYSDSREPYRYSIAALVMLSSGILWLMSSLVSKYQLFRKHYIIIAITLLIGLLVGLADDFPHCGGECGCFWYYGYPGRWLRISTCVTGPVIEPIWARNWGIDFPSFIADIVFWSGVGLIIAMFWDTIRRIKTASEEVK